MSSNIDISFTYGGLHYANLPYTLTIEKNNG